MIHRSPINNFLVGPEWIESRIEYKQAVLRGQLGLLSALICIIYLVVDPIRGSFLFLPWYLGFLVVSSFVIFLNRIKRYTLSSSILIISGTILVFFLAGVGSPERGVYMYFLCMAVASLVLFYHSNLRLGIFYVAFSSVMALLAYWGDFNFMNYEPDSESFIRLSFTINFIIGLFTVTAVVIIIIKRNQESEKFLLNSTEELKGITEELLQSKNRYSMAVEGTRAGIYEWDVKNNKVYTTARWRELLGFSLEEKLDLSMEFFLSLGHPDDKEVISKYIAEQLKAGGNYQYELRMRRSDGSYCWFLDSGIIKTVDGEPVLAVGSIIDINERINAVDELKNKNYELQKANDELDRFVYSASHDIRAPLSSLTGLINIAKITDDLSEHEKYFNMMTTRIKDMEGFISDVTNYSRNSRLDVEHSIVNLKELFENLKESFAIVANEKGVDINLDIAEDLEIKTDRTRLKIVLSNILANAINHHDLRKTSRFVKIWSESKNGVCNIILEDNGTGIDVQHQDKIFNMFYRASESSSGSGLGLYIVKETLEKLNGEIDFKSELIKGSKFTIKLASNN